jgi:hypothetical protein
MDPVAVEPTSMEEVAAEGASDLEADPPESETEAAPSRERPTMRRVRRQPRMSDGEFRPPSI